MNGSIPSIGEHSRKKKPKAGRLWRGEAIDYFETGKPMAIEMGAPIELLMEGFEVHLRSEVIGMEPGNYIIIKTPKLKPAVLRKIYPGTEIIVQYLHQGTVFGFKSELRGIVSVPAKLMFLAYPKMIFRYELRSQKRMSCCLPAKLFVDDWETDGVIQDISRDGCRCSIRVKEGEAPPNLMIDQLIVIRFQLPGVDGEQVISGFVKNYHSTAEQMLFGVKFHRSDPDVRERIFQYISAVEPF